MINQPQVIQGQASLLCNTLYLRKFLLFSFFLLFYCFGYSQIGPYIDYNEQTGQFKVANLKPPTPQPKGSSSPEWGNFLWEFGDGNFSFEAEPKHYFSAGDRYQVKVYLTPHYSFDAPLELTKEVRTTTSSRGSKSINYDLNKRAVYIESTGTEYLVGGHEMQFIVHYQAPQSRAVEEGYLLLFYNNQAEQKDLKVSYAPFSIKDTRLYYAEEELGDDFLFLPREKLSAGGSSMARDLSNQHNNLNIFKTGALLPGQKQRIFCTIASDERLKEKKDKNRDLSITALWLPANGLFDEKKNVYSHIMQILEVHDPNRIRVDNKKAYFLKNKPTTITYKVDFQNKAEGVVNDLAVRLALGSELDVSTATMNEEKMDPQLPLCSSFSFAENSCYTVDTKIGLLTDSLSFTLKNIGLEGKKAKGLFQSKKSTKGSITFSVKNSSKKTGKTNMRAYIEFIGSEEIIKTNSATTKWRQRSGNLSIGVNGGQRATHYEHFADGGFLKNYTISLSTLDAPLGRGILYGGQIGLTKFNFTRSTISEVGISELLPNGGYWFRSDTLSIQTFDIRGLGGYQINKFLRFYAGAGLSIPVSSDLTVNGGVANSIEGGPFYSEQSSTSAGLFSGETDPAVVLGQAIELKNSIGFTTTIGMEVGLPNDFTLGLAYEMRHFSEFYVGSCTTIRNWQLYVRGKLFAY